MAEATGSAGTPGANREGTAPGSLQAQDKSSAQRAREAIASGRRGSKNQVRLVSVVAFLILVAAWAYGHFQNGTEIGPILSDVLPGARRFEQQSDFYIGYSGNPDRDALVGYAATGEAVGYAGPIQILVGVNPDGDIIGMEVLSQRETPSFFRLLKNDDFFDQLLEKDYSDPMRLGQDLDAASGATISSEAVARAVRNATRSLGSGPIGAQLPASPEPILFGVPEILLIALYIAGYFGHRSRNQPAKKWIRRVTLAAGAIGLGFIYNKPLTIANFISLLSGYWPDWHTNLYWFLLLGGILFVTTAQAKNPYCSWFCPFGAVQEGLGKVSGAKLYRPRSWHKPLQWLQRGLAFGAIVVGLAFRQPGAVSYEPFGTMFDFTGSTPQWILLGLVLVTSLLIYRPFCNYLCPMLPIVDYIGEARRTISGFTRRVSR